MLQGNGEFRAWSKLLKTSQRDTIVFLYLIIIVLVAERKSKHTLFLQVCLMNSGKALSQDYLYVQEARLHSGMFTRRSLTVIILCNHDAADSLCLVSLSCCRNLNIIAIQLVLHLIALTVKGVHGTHQEVIRDILKMSTELQPRSSHRNMVSGTLSFRLDKQRHVYQILTIPRSERSQFLKTIAVRSNNNLNICIFFAWSNESLIFYGKSLWRESKSCRSIELHAVAFLVQQSICSRIEIQSASDGQGHSKLRTSNEGKRIMITIGTTAEVSIKRGNDSILASIIFCMTLPLSDARTAGVGHDKSSNLLEVIEDAITLGSIANLL